MESTVDCVCSVKCKCPANPNYIRARLLKQTLRQVQKKKVEEDVSSTNTRLESEAAQLVLKCEEKAAKGEDWILLHNPDQGVLKILRKKHFLQLERVEHRDVGNHLRRQEWADWKPYRFTPLVED